MHDFRAAILAPAAGGVPSDGNPLPDPLARATSYEHTISATFGFESLRIAFACTLDEAIFWAGQLMASIAVFGPDAMPAWEGYLAGVEISAGARQRSISLDPLGNRVRVRYTTVNGVAGVTSAVSDASSQARYGVKDLVEALPTTTAAAAANRAAVLLADRAWPRMQPTTEIATGAAGSVTVTLVGAGWYGALDWLLTSNATTSSAVTTAQVASLLTSYAATNAFLSTATRITASGISDTQAIADDTTYRAAIERLLGQGNGAQRYAWGVYEDRVFVAAPWAGATPEAVMYRGTLGDGARIAGDGGNVIAPWSVRPDAIYAESDLLDVAAISAQPDAAGRHYIERVTFGMDASGYRLRLEPAASDDLAAQLARLGG